MVDVSKFRGVIYAALCAVWLGSAPVHAEALSPAAQDEIDQLLSRLGTSGCQFKRNGSWHTAKKAQSHLRRKLDYLIDRDAVASAEQFIERAASKSSRSGKPYLVKCGKQAPLSSGPWLRGQLKAVRSAAKPAAQ